MKAKYSSAAMNRSISMMVLGSVTGSAMLSSCVSTAGKADGDTGRPNVILILTDDQGYGDLSVHGNPVLKTPNLDRLHDQSVRFTDFHVAPMSSPTRGQIMTGRDAYFNGCTAVCMGRSMVREELPTMAGLFKESGYRTIQIGKWHMGDSYPYRPQDRGFDETVHHGAWGIGSIADYYQNTYWDAVFEANGETSEYDGYCTDVWFDLARDYILNSTKSHEPYFMYLATNCPHAPHLCDDSYSDPYIERVSTLQEARFFGQIANIDENMGHLMSFLDSLGVADNTLLIYMTDNGSSRGFNVYNAGMRGHKTEPYEGGHRVPLFIRWPQGNIGEPRDIDALTECQDLLPTLVDMCNLKKPDGLKFDGQSLLPLFKGKRDDFDDRMLVVQYDNPYRPEENNAVLWRKWRLVMHKELYDLETDPAQQTDIADKHPDVFKKMTDFYDAWTNSTMPEYSKTRYIHIGNRKANPLMLYSSDWSGSYADNDGNLFAGDSKGKWFIEADSKGDYEVTLYRWHPVSGIALNEPAEDKAGRTRGAVPVVSARLKVGQFDEIVQTTDGQASAKFMVSLDKGSYELETMFYDKEGNELCSAYYTKVELKK